MESLPDLERLRVSLRGPLLLSSNPGYDEARAVWNGRLDARPAAVARCTGAADVLAAVDFARETGAPLVVKSGGHSYAGLSTSDGALVVDLSLMDAVRVDPEARTARVEPGTTWGAFDHEAQAFGLATPGATVSTVAVAGVTLGGGAGFLTRKHGLTADNLLSADVVTASGGLIHASAEEEADLFWALRGGGGNVGVVTSFEYALHPVGPEVLAGQVFYPIDQAEAVLRRYREFAADAPDEVQCYPFFLRVPPLPMFPDRYHGEVALDLVACYAGNPEEGEGALRPLRTMGTPFLEAVQPTPYAALQRSFDAGLPEGKRYHSRAHYLPELSDETVAVVVEHAGRLVGPYSVAYLDLPGGAPTRVDPGATAFPHRDAAYTLHVLGGWEDPGRDGEVTGWVDGFHAAVAPYATGGVYVNLLGEGEEDRVPAAYGPNYDRLQRVKREWDPDNLFRATHNVPPAT